MSLIHGVVTVLLKVKIRAGAAKYRPASKSLRLKTYSRHQNQCESLAFQKEEALNQNINTVKRNEGPAPTAGGGWLPPNRHWSIWLVAPEWALVTGRGANAGISGTSP